MPAQTEIDESSGSVTGFLEDFLFLLEPSTRENRRRNSVLYGGRGGVKSYAAADAALIRGTQQYERILCCRETQDSIRESVHALLDKRINDLGLQEYYEVQQRTILGPQWEGYGRTQFIFGGLKRNPDTLKSLEGATIAWVEEAATVSKESWDKLIPTVRWQDRKTGRESEIWVTFNPELSDDDTYVRWVLNPPPYTKVVKTSYLDNPWLPEILRIEAEHAKKTSPERDYPHIWLGECLGERDGAIYAKELKAAREEGRIGSVPYDRSRPVNTYWDLGYHDTNCIWFIQQVGNWWNVIDFLEGQGEELTWYVREMQGKPYVYGIDHLPHDGVDALLHGKLTGSSDRSKSPEMVLRSLGRKVMVAPKLSQNSGIDATRRVFPQCRFDEENCAKGLRALALYQWGKDAANGQQRSKPLHDKYSHAADALRTFGVSAKPEKRQAPPPVRQPRAALSVWS